MNREQFLTIDFQVKNNSFYYSGTIYEPYNLFFIISQGKKSEHFQITYTDMKREPIGKFSGAIGLLDGKNIINLLIKDTMNKELYSEVHEFII